MKLTKTQIDIIEHRLEVPDAIADAIDDSLEQIGACLNDDEFAAAVEAIRKTIRTDFDRLQLDNIEWMILEDAVMGSTYVDMADDAVSMQEITPQKAAGIANSYENLLEKLQLTY